MKVTIVGIGLMGGSFSLALKALGDDFHFTGVSRKQATLDKALSMNLIDAATTDLEAGVRESDLVLVAVPVGTGANLTERVLSAIQPKAVVFDMGSTKANIVQQLSNHPKRGRFVATHPIAGTENSGPEAAISNLYQNKTVIICDRDKSDADAVDLVESLYQRIGMRLTYMEAKEHDLHLAYVSHLSHVTSFALGLTVLEMEKDEKNIFDMAGSGFSSTARLAKSSPEMWAPIFDQNKSNLTRAINAYIKKMELFKAAIDSGDQQQCMEIMQQANDIRRILSREED